MDTGETRTDLARRREVKYALPQMDIGKLRRLLEVNCQRLIHSGQVSVVRSIYFDDSRLSACRANLDGLGLRRKLRIRWYDTPMPGTKFFAEIKWRDNRATGKHRMQMCSDKPLAELSYEEIRRGLVDSIPEYLAADAARYHEPVVVVEYKREHFASSDGLRITLDYDLRFYDQFAKRMISLTFPKPLEGFIVLEGKTPLGRESELRQWFHPLTPRATRCSKYVYGCREIGIIGSHEI
ncbi:MAG: polyphosphate polymerase domain-containing protein [Pirellulales bacterium]|nr:polyphosphate polymerase domain-containing protein [Pirellulales bacterium]